MAQTEYHVIYNEVESGLGVPGVGTSVREFSKAEAEKLGANASVAEPKFFTEKITIYGSIKEAKVLTIEANSLGEAAKYVRIVLNGQIAGIIPGAKAPKTVAEAAEKPVNTVKTTEYKAEAVL